MYVFACVRVCMRMCVCLCVCLCVCVCVLVLFPLLCAQDPSYQFKDIKQLMMGMLETYNYEEV